MEESHIYLILDKIKGRPYYVGKWGGKYNLWYITGSTYLRRYIRRFGLECFWNRFEKVILEYVPLSFLNEREEFYIKKYSTYRYAGNRTKGGTFDWKYRTPRKKEVIQYSLEGEFIREWDSAKAPYLAGIVKNYDGISCCIRGVQETAGGYIWKEKKSLDYSKTVSKTKRTHSLPNRPVLQLDNSGNIMNEYLSPRECSQMVGISYSILMSILKGKRKPWFGQTFKYKE